MIPVAIKVVNPLLLEFGIISSGTQGAAGYDLKACISEPIIVHPDETAKIPTGLAVFIGNRHYAGFIMPRSGLAANFNITLQNCVGLLDSDFQGEVQILFRNEGKDAYRINPGDRIAQLVVLPVIHPMWEVVRDFDHFTPRGELGFGSTGTETRRLGSPLDESNETLSGRELPTQSLGNEQPLEVGEIKIVAPVYTPTGLELEEQVNGAE